MLKKLFKDEGYKEIIFDCSETCYALQRVNGNINLIQVHVLYHKYKLCLFLNIM